MNAEFHAELVEAQKDDDDTWYISFAEHWDDDTPESKYLTLARARRYDAQDVALGMATYYVERDGQGWSMYGGIRQFTLEREQATIELNEVGAVRLGGIDALKITFQIDQKSFGKLRRQLRTIFFGSECHLEILDTKAKQ